MAPKKLTFAECEESCILAEQAKDEGLMTQAQLETFCKATWAREACPSDG